ncbi:MAG: lysophospholipid acyltransferase family protein [Casimicrobiaceae bacterium]|nr:lysophospholipid acyltransferase family protein [Casimicrobiaceae bacterium]
MMGVVGTNPGLSVRTRLAFALADALARRSLVFQYRLGGWLGRLALFASHRLRQRLSENLARAGYATRVSPSAVAANLGRMAIETLALWRTPDTVALSRVIEVTGWDEVREARRCSRGIVFLTPHLATFEYAACFVAHEMPLTVMYRPPKLRWAEPLMRAGRTRMGMRAVPADLSGVRAMYAALKRGEAIGILPDQVPDVARGAEGVWAPFFGQPALTMTLAQTLAQRTDAAVFMVSTRRFKGGRGFALDFAPVEMSAKAPQEAARLLNGAIERAVATAPEQYLWSYNRFKIPSGVRAATIEGHLR